MKLRAGVVGAGIVGACTAFELASAGADVTVFEQFTIDHDRGSSYGDSRIIRRFYDDPYYTKLMSIAYPLWQRLEAASGVRLYERLGGLYFGPRDHPRLAAAIEGMSAVGASPELIAASKLRGRFPAFAFDDDEAGIVDDEAGSLRASRCVSAAVSAAVAAGAVLRTECRVQRVQTSGASIAVRTADGESHRFDRVAVCAGPWAPRFIAQSTAPVRATRQQYVHLRPTSHAEFFRDGSMPIWIDAAENWYGFPEHGDVAGVKIASHDFGETVDPDDVRRDVDAAIVERTRRYARRRLPALENGEMTYAKVCLYTVSPDEDFIIDEMPDVPGCHYFTGCSGHAFKFGTLAGAVIADRILEREPRADVARWRASRLQ
jgi:sarcosine oxidase